MLPFVAELATDVLHAAHGRGALVAIALLELLVGVAFSYVYVFAVIGIYFGFDILPEMMAQPYPSNHYILDANGHSAAAFFGVSSPA